MKLEDKVYQLAISRIDGVGDSLAKNLISYCGSASAVFLEKRNLLLKIPGIGSMTADNIKKFKAFSKIENELELLNKNKIQVLFYKDLQYPSRLKHFEDSPIILYSKGRIDYNAKSVISVVGTRMSTPYGKQFTEELIQSLSQHDVIVVSGLALGTDTNAHKAAIKFGIQTVGVLGHGFSTLYPTANKQLAKQIIESGGLLTEFPFFTPGKKENFPRRNRIVAGMCDAVIVVESGIKGGSLITADIANSYDIDVYALPGKITDTWSLGCNKLIHNHQAATIFQIDALLRDLGYQGMTHSKMATSNLFNQVTDEELKVIKVLELGVKGIDVLQFETDIAFSRLSYVLINLEFRNIINVLPGKRYALNQL